MRISKRVGRTVTFGLISTFAMLGVTTPANAGTGCNGVVNVFVWGCAPWDNNNGSQYPYYQKRQVTVRADHIVVQQGVPMAQVKGQYYPLIGNDGASLIGHDGATVRVWVGN